MSAIRDIAGHPTFVQTIGTGRRRAVFLHCTLAHSGAWDGVAARLSPLLTMTVFDRPGHGRSGAWHGGGATALHDLTTAIAADLIDGSAHLVGHSWGATVALRLAMEQPEKVESLTLIEPVTMQAAAGHPADLAYRTTMQEFTNRLDAGDRTGAARLFNDMISPEAPFDTLPAKTQAKLAERIHLIAFETGVTLDDTPGLLAPGRLEALDIPVLALDGARSPVMIRAVLDKLAARLPNLRRVTVPGAGHMAPITHPHAVADAIAAQVAL